MPAAPTTFSSASPAPADLTAGVQCTVKVGRKRALARAGGGGLVAKAKWTATGHGYTAFANPEKSVAGSGGGGGGGGGGAGIERRGDDGEEEKQEEEEEVEEEEDKSDVAAQVSVMKLGKYVSAKTRRGHS